MRQMIPGAEAIEADGRAWLVPTPWPAVALIVVVGLGAGALTRIGQSVLPAGFGQAANAISPWLLVAFALGSVMPSWRGAAAAGVRFDAARPRRVLRVDLRLDRDPVAETAR